MFVSRCHGGLQGRPASSYLPSILIIVAVSGLVLLLLICVRFTEKFLFAIKDLLRKERNVKDAGDGIPLVNQPSFGR